MSLLSNSLFVYNYKNARGTLRSSDSVAQFIPHLSTGSNCLVHLGKHAPSQTSDNSGTIWPRPSLHWTKNKYSSTITFCPGTIHRFQWHLVLYGGHRLTVRNSQILLSVFLVTKDVKYIQIHIIITFSRSIQSGQCVCNPGHHGKECSLPEVIWRAFIASRYGAVISRRHGVQRRILFISEAESAAHQAAQIHVLRDVVDLFVVPSIQDKRLIRVSTVNLHFIT